MRKLSGDDGPMGSRLIFKEMTKATTSLEQRVDVLEKKITAYKHTIGMIGFEMERMKIALDSLEE